jgi:hypothetical protein
MALDIEAILDDGHIDETETLAIAAEIYGEEGDGGTDITEGELRILFTLKDSADSYCSAFGDLVVQATTDFALNDENTPNVVDEYEASVLNELIQGDGVTDEVEERILISIRNRATSIHPSLMG